MISSLPHETTIAGLFEKAFHYRIPPYQRAYSWTEKHWSRFIKDLEEQPGSDGYYLGHFLFQSTATNSADDRLLLEVIDGQQRLTTIIIFFACAIRELEARLATDSSAPAITPSQLQEFRNRYLQDSDGPRFRTVGYDDTFFNRLIIQGTEESVDKAAPRSQKLIRSARNYFTKHFEEAVCPTELLLTWCSLLETAFTSTFVLTGEKAQARATQIFAYQNDRGISPTNLELLKAYLMHQIYLLAKDGADIRRIDDVQNDFAEIHGIHEKIDTLDEDQVLAHHCVAFLPHWHQPLESIEKMIAELEPEERIPWITQFSSELRQTFRLVHEIQEDSEANFATADLLFLDAYHSWPLLLKLHRLHGNEKQSTAFKRALRLMEITLFKKEFSRADFRTNDFHHFAKSWPGDLDVLTEQLSTCASHGFKHYWSFNQVFRDALARPQQYFQATRYLLWKHENWLAEKRNNPPLLPFQFLNIIGDRRWDETIEHIMPQNPAELELDQEFRETHLHCLGNLAMMNRSKNASASNALPLEKRHHFFNSGLISHKRIVEQLDMSESKTKWWIDEINARQDEIVGFALQHWEALEEPATNEQTSDVP